MTASSTDTGRSPEPLFARPRGDASVHRAAGWLAVAILTLACAFHVYWAVGGDWAAATAYGSTELPPRGVVAAVAGLLAAAAAVLLARIGAWRLRLHARLLRWAPWALVAVFTLAGVGNLTAPEESYARDWHVLFFGPLLLILAVLCAVAARSPLPDARRR